MKYLLCQPDTHNGFGSLIGLKLTYFTVDRADRFLCSDKHVLSHDPRSSTLIHVQFALTLPADFAASPLCFSLANHSLYNLDMAFVASRSGLAAVAVMSSSHLLYAPDRSPSALRDVLDADCCASTVTWMRDKPLVFVGFLSGCVEWYHVTLSAARLQEARQSHAPSPVASQQREHRAVEQTHENGNGDGVRVRLCGAARFPETGAFLTSDWFPATGHIVAGAERAVYVFSSAKPAVPLHCVEFAGSAALACHPFMPIVGCLSFGLAARDEASRDTCVCYVYEWTGSALRVAVAGEIVDKTAPPRVGAYYSCSWKFSVDMCLAVSNVVEGRVHVMHFIRTEPDLEMDGMPCHLLSTRSVPLPLHALANVEFISAATSALMSLSTPSPSSLSTPPDTFFSAKLDASPTLSPPDVLLKEKALALQMLPPFGRFKNRGDRRGFVGPSAESAKHKDFSAPLHAPAVRSGFGALSCVVGVNGAGEVAAVPADADATATPLGSAHIAVGIGSTVFVASLSPAARGNRGDAGRWEEREINEAGEKGEINEAGEKGEINEAGEKGEINEAGEEGEINEAETVNGDDGMAQRMRRRLAAGFGTSAEVNERALRNARGEADLRVLFAYIAVLEHVGVVAPGGVVPSMIDFLSLPDAPSTLQLIDLKLLPPHNAVVCPSSTSQNDSRRLLLLHVLDWIPALPSDTQPQSPLSSFAHPHATSSPSSSFSPSPSSSSALCKMSRDALERRVAVEVLHRRWRTAAVLLRFHHRRHAAYAALASLLQCRDVTGKALREAPALLQSEFFAQLSPWLRVAFRFVQSPDTAESCERIYTEADLSLWDRMAVAVLLERNTPKLAAWLRKDISRACSLTQRLLLDGISAESCPLMQCIVDCTADFQLAACLFARIGAAAAAAVRNGAHKDKDKEKGKGKEKAYEAAAEAWEMWAAAYRAFLNDEQEFVKRTTFDLACQQLAGMQCRENVSASRPASNLSRAAAPAAQQEQILAQLLVLHRHCSVCAAPVTVRRQCARDSYASCSACLHGGHANHLQEWFARHRTCPVDNCSCRCDHGGNVP